LRCRDPSRDHRVHERPRESTPLDEQNGFSIGTHLLLKAGPDLRMTMRRLFL
jgi:hypothetical protein